MGALCLISQAQAEDTQSNVPQPPQIEQPAAQPQAPSDATSPAASAPSDAAPASPPNYDLDTVVIDYKEHKIGDTVPPEYLTKTYTITEWQKRNLTAPEENSHWTYVGGNYLLITNDTGKILKAESGDIFFRH